MADIPLRDYRSRTADLSGSDRRLIVAQALKLLDGIYVHHGSEAATRLAAAIHSLRNLEKVATIVDEREFHDRLLKSLRSIRDRHTFYQLPKPFRDIAFLPYTVRECIEGGERQVVVTQVASQVNDARFRAGVTITHWNDRPISQVVQQLAEADDAAHPDARQARAVEALTVRPTSLLPLPDEDVVTVTYDCDGQSFATMFEWQVRPFQTAEPERTLNLATDGRTDAIRQFELELFPQAQVRSDRAARAALQAAGFGYIQIPTFYTEPVQSLPDFARLLESQPAAGVVLDIRRNPGGVIPWGERLLQLFTPRRIEPMRWQFRATEDTVLFCRRVSEFSGFPESDRKAFGRYVPSLDECLALEAGYSDAFSVTEPEEANSYGQVYHGRVLVLADALTYSVGDIFAAGFQDHAIGEVLCTDDRTGGGGSNDIGYEVLTMIMPEAFPALPRGASFRVSTRRCIRVGRRAGSFLERRGVRPEHMHRYTRADRLNGDTDLFARAVQLLSARS